MRLLSADELAPFTADAARDVSPELLADPDCGPPLRYYVALTNGPAGADLTPEDRTYNRYYWFLRFAAAHRKRHGFDAGVEQQVFQILERADLEIGRTLDWRVIERLEFLARAEA